MSNDANRFLSSFFFCIKVHRRLLHDDAFGVGEALNEVAYGKGLIARGSHYIVFGPKKHTEKQSTEATERFIQLQTLLPPWLLFSDLTDYSYSEWKDTFNHFVSFSSSNHLIQLNFEFFFLIISFLLVHSHQDCHFHYPKMFIFLHWSRGNLIRF